MALGIVPVGVTYWFGDEELQGVYPWAQEYLGDAELPTVLDRTPTASSIETVAALAPDLIIGQYAGITEQEYKKLSAMGVPVVAQSGDYADYGMPWDEMALNIGTAVGQPKAAQELIDAVKKRITDEAAAHPEFQGQTAARHHAVRGTVPLRPRGPALADAARPRLLPALADHRRRGQRVRRLGQLGADHRPRRHRRRGVDRPRGRQAGEGALRGHHGVRRGPLVRHQRRTTARTTWRTAS